MRFQRREGEGEWDGDGEGEVGGAGVGVGCGWVGRGRNSRGRKKSGRGWKVYGGRVEALRRPLDRESGQAGDGEKERQQVVWCVRRRRGMIQTRGM